MGTPPSDIILLALNINPILPNIQFLFHTTLLLSHFSNHVHRSVYHYNNTTNADVLYKVSIQLYFRPLLIILSCYLSPQYNLLVRLNNKNILQKQKLIH